MMTVLEYWFLYSTSRCLNMTAGYPFVAEQKVGIAGEEVD